MGPSEQLLKLLLATFPPQPLPTRFFWEYSGSDNSDEFSHDLLQWFAQRPWTEIKIRDWAMTGHVGVSRELLEPAAFLYYLPSLLFGAAQEPEYLDWALEAIPSGRDRQPKGKWWGQLLKTITPDQIDALHYFLAHIQINFSRSEPFAIGVDEALASEAEQFWNAQRS